MASERTKMIEESKVDPDEDMMTRGIRKGLRGLALGASKAGDFVEQGIEDLKSGANTVMDDINMLRGTPRGKMKEEYLQEKFEPGYKAKKRQQAEAASELLRESRRGQAGFKKGGSVSSASKRADGCAIKGKTRGKIV